MTDRAVLNQLYDELANKLNLEQLTPDSDGGIRFDINEDQIIIFDEGESSLLLIVPIAELSPDIDFGSMLWLLRRNLYDSDLEPFRLAVDEAGNLILWGRLTLESISANSLLELMKELSTEAVSLRTELGLEEDEEFDSEPAQDHIMISND